MLTVLVRDLVGTRRVVTGLLIIVVAIIGAGAVDLVVALASTRSPRWRPPS